MEKDNVKVLMIEGQPVHYRTGFYGKLSKKIDAVVLYCSQTSGYANTFDCDSDVGIDLLAGHRHRFVKNFGSTKFPHFFARINPGVVREINQYDVIGVHGIGHFSYCLALIYAKLKKKPVVIQDDRDLEAYSYMPSFHKKVRKFISKRFFSLGDAFPYTCEANRQYWIAHGVPQKKLFPMICSVDNDYLQQERRKYLPQRDQLRSELGITTDDFVVILAAQLSSRKHPMDLLKGVEGLPPPLRDKVVVLFVGSGSDMEGLKRYALGKNIRAIFSGYQRFCDISKFYTLSDAYAMLSEYDPSPKSMNEALNFELPVVCTDCVGTAPEMVKNGINGFLIRLGDTDAIRDAVQFWIENPEKSKMMGQASLEIVSKYNLEQYAESYATAVRSVIGK